RTPFGAYGGLLKDFTATDLAEIAARSALSAGKISPEIIDSVIVGNVMQSSRDAAYLARHVGLRVGVPIPTPALTINRLCGSGFQSIVNGCQEISLNDSEVVLCGGTENMSQAFCCSKYAFWNKTRSGSPAENLAAKYNITREECDRYAFKTQQRWKAVKVKKSKQSLERDEHPRPETTLEQLGKLPTVFKKDGTVTAGNASGVSDGAGAVILASEDAVKKHNLTPLARIVSYHAAGCDPNIMGIAFAPQYLSVEKVLGLDPEKTNVNGGAIALGHPLGASGSRITSHLVHELRYQVDSLAAQRK
ncbi:putative 3-ketoacyl-CoA thiolase protein, partial [Naja naja]